MLVVGAGPERKESVLGACLQEGQTHEDVEEEEEEEDDDDEDEGVVSLPPLMKLGFKKKKREVKLSLPLFPIFFFFVCLFVCLRVGRGGFNVGAF